jgi:hypothetical protein
MRIDTPQKHKWVQELFDLMLLEYGKKFVDQWDQVDARTMVTHWATQLGEFTPSEIQTGVTGLSGRDWPPSLPEFKKMCRPPLNALSAYYEAIRGLQARRQGKLGQWSHPAIFWAATPMAFDLESQTWAQVQPRWQAQLTHQLAQERWEPIPTPALALAHETKPPQTNAHAARMLQALGAQGITRSPHASAPRDERRWAHKILERVKQGGDAYTTLAVVEMAKAALGMPL